MFFLIPHLSGGVFLPQLDKHQLVDPLADHDDDDEEEEEEERDVKNISTIMFYGQCLKKNICQGCIDN